MHIALRAGTPTQYARVMQFLRYFYEAEPSNGMRASYCEAKKRYHGNSVLYIELIQNPMTGKYSMGTTTRSIMRAGNLKYSFIGNMTQYANTNNFLVFQKATGERRTA